MNTKIYEYYLRILLTLRIFKEYGPILLVHFDDHGDTASAVAFEMISLVALKKQAEVELIDI